MAVQDRKTALLGNLLARVIRKTVPGKLFPENCQAHDGVAGQGGPAPVLDTSLTTENTGTAMEHSDCPWRSCTTMGPHCGLSRHEGGMEDQGTETSHHDLLQQDKAQGF